VCPQCVVKCEKISGQKGRDRLQLDVQGDDNDNINGFDGDGVFVWMFDDFVTEMIVAGARFVVWTTWFVGAVVCLQ